MSNDIKISRELAPCPFCGGLPTITKHFRHEMYSFTHRCSVIGPISRDFRENPQGHIDMWNTRIAEQPAPVAVVLPERLTSAELEELEVIEVLLHGQRLSNLAGTMAAARQFIEEIACSAASIPRAVVLPERKPIEALEFNWTTEDVENTGWNACLDKVKELNQ